MKHKKFAAFAAGLLITAALASCGGGSGEKEAIENAISGTLVTSTVSSNPINPNTRVELSADYNEAFTVFTSIVKKDKSNNKHTVTIDWTWDASLNDRIKLVDIGSDTQKNIEFTYPDIGEAVVSIEITANLKCGSATGSAKYLANLNPSSIQYDDYSLEKFYETKNPGEEDETFWFIDESGKIMPNHDQKYLFVSLSGKLTYVAPDKNWGILADGDKYIELYRLDECSDMSKFKVGDYVKIYGEVAKYYGNIQIQFIKKMVALTDSSKIKDPVEISNIPEGINTKTSEDFKSFCSGISNRVGTLQGTMVETKSSPDLNTRFTFKVKIGGNSPITVAYDYHTAKEDATVSAAYKAFFAAATAGKSVTVRGTLRWTSPAGEDATVGPNGEWTIVPFLATDLQVK